LLRAFRKVATEVLSARVAALLPQRTVAAQCHQRGDKFVGVVRHGRDMFFGLVVRAARAWEAHAFGAQGSCHEWNALKGLQTNKKSSREN
jgi:hypothetical protein